MNVSLSGHRYLLETFYFCLIKVHIYDTRKLHVFANISNDDFCRRFEGRYDGLLRRAIYCLGSISPGIPIISALLVFNFENNLSDVVN